MMRRMPVVLAGALALITLGFATLSLVSLMAHERTRTPVSFATGITTIELSIGAGDVVLNGSDRLDVSGVRTIDRGLARPTITEVRDGSTLRLRTSCKSFFAANCSVRYELDVPKGVRITGSSSGGGIRINGATGPVDVSSSGGGVTVAKSSGPLTVSSSGGGIQICPARATLSAPIRRAAVFELSLPNLRTTSTCRRQEAVSPWSFRTTRARTTSMRHHPAAAPGSMFEPIQFHRTASRCDLPVAA